MDKNPLLSNEELITYSHVKPIHIEPAIDQILEENRARIVALISSQQEFSFADFVYPMQEIEDRLSRVWSSVEHLHAIASSPELRAAHKRSLAKVSAYTTELAQNEKIQQIFQTIANSPNFAELSQAQKKVVENELRDFRLAGVNLPPNEKKRFAAILLELAQLEAKFEEHIVDATNHWHYETTHEDDLRGLPQRFIEKAALNATQDKQPGWKITLDYPSYATVMQNSTNRELRKLFYSAFQTRASDQGPLAGKYDNSPLMFKILSLRHELSQLVGFNNYAEYSLATKALKNPSDVLKFLYELLESVRPKAEKEFAEIAAFAKKTDGIETLQPWDVIYYREKLFSQTFNFNEELLRPYFNLDRVITGLFSLTSKLFNIRIEEQKNIDTWNSEVKVFAFYDAEQNLLGHLYLDLYVRPNKQGGAWVGDARARYKHHNGHIQLPAAFLTCNFTAPNPGQPSLLNHQEVVTLFHEFGHALHHLLTKVDYSAISGTHGVEWDAVEFPSQLMEFFVWQESFVNSIAQHYQTGEKLSPDFFASFKKSKNFYSGLDIIRQLEFALFDFELHLNFDEKLGYEQIQNTLNKIRTKTTMISPPSWNRFQHSFSHIFAGGYAAGYYSYLWAEVMAYNGFDVFLQTGITDANTGAKFRSIILEQGGTCNALDLFTQFYGKKPDINSYLRQQDVLT